MQDHKLPDSLEPDLKVVFVGTAAGKRSAELGHYYAGHGNRFWQTLYEVGLTPRLFRPGEFRELLPHGIGLTDMSKLGAGMDHQISAHQFDPEQFRANLRRYRPRALAFTSKKAASIGLDQTTTGTIQYGQQISHSPGDPNFFVLPSPSGAARSYWSIAPWQELADWLKAS